MKTIDIKDVFPLTAEQEHAVSEMVRKMQTPIPVPINAEQAFALKIVNDFYTYLYQNYTNKPIELFNGVALRDYVENILKIK